MNAHRILLRKVDVKIEFCSFWNLSMRAITPSCHHTYINYDIELSFKPLSQGTEALK